MLKIRVRTKGVRFTILIPNAILYIGISILSSKFFQKQIQEWAKEPLKRKNRDFTIPLIDKKVLNPILKELNSHKGLLLVDVKTKDGTEVMVRL